MPISNWFGRKCGNCGHKSATDLSKYTCQKCGTVGCPECMGDKGVDEDGNIYMCKKCAMKTLDKRLQHVGLSVPQ
jgi:hypothetical protein